MFQTDITILEKIQSPNDFSHRIQKKKYEEGQLVEG